MILNYTLCEVHLISFVGSQCCSRSASLPLKTSTGSGSGKTSGLGVCWLLRRASASSMRITDRLFVRPPCCRYAPTEFNELVFWNVDVKGSDLHCCVVRVAVNLRGRELRPGGLLFFCRAFL